MTWPGGGRGGRVGGWGGGAADRVENAGQGEWGGPGGRACE